MSSSFEDLEVWQLSVDLCVNIYQITHFFPKTELYSLADQIKRSCTSVSANIAEGHGRHSSKEFTHYLYQARGSLMETRSHVLVAQKLFTLNPIMIKPTLQQITNLSVKLNNLIKSISHRRTTIVQPSNHHRTTV